MVYDGLLSLIKFTLPCFVSTGAVEFLGGGGGGGVCKVIITSNPTAVKVDLSCIEVRLGF